MCYVSQLVNITENNSFHTVNIIVAVSVFHTRSTIAEFSRKLGKSLILNVMNP